MPRIPLVFGGGLERETGLMAVRGTSFEDLRNVILFDGKAAVRKGFSERITFSSSTHVIAVQPIRSQRTAIVVTYDSASGQVNVHGMDAAGQNAQLIGTWFTKTADLGTPPIVVTTEVFGQVFLAHAAQSVTGRAATFVYDRRKAPNLYALEADLDLDGTAEPIKFRGVERYLDYLFGWGYGDETDQERPELLRVSQPGIPTEFKAEHYLIVGDRAAPIITCKPAGDTFMAFKEGEHHVILGYDRATFGVKPIDELFGCIGDRLAVNVSGLCFFWSSHGPRLSLGRQPSRDVAIPLDYFGFDPLSLVAESEAEDAFAVYEPTRRVVLFFWGKRVYALSVRGGLQNARWSYWEIGGFTPLCGGVLFQGRTGVFPPPTGFPVCTSLDGGTGDELVVNWSNNGQSGDEFLEIWLQEIQQLALSYQMDTDGGGGVAKDFTSFTAGAHTAAFSINQTAQKIAVTAATGAGFSGVQQGTPSADTMPVTAGKTYMLAVQAKAASLVGGARGAFTVEWYDVADVLISTEPRVTFTNANFELHKFEATAPVGAVSATMRFEFESQASGQTGDVWFKNARFFDSSAAWSLEEQVNVNTSATQSFTVPGKNPGSFYRARLRYGRGFEYTAGYASGDPDDWPNSSECFTQTAIAGLVPDGLHNAFFFTANTKRHVMLTWATTKATWAALQAAGATAGFEVERDTGAGFNPLVTLLANRNWKPALDHERDGRNSWGYDKRWFGRTWNVQITPDPYVGPWPAVSTKDDLVLFEWVDEDVAGAAVDYNYRVRMFIGSARSSFLTREQWLGPVHEVEEATHANAHPTGHGPTTVTTWATPTPRTIHVQVAHNDWYRFMKGADCEGLNARINGVDFQANQVLSYSMEIWYEDQASPGYVLKTPRTECDGTNPDIPATKDTITGVTAGTWNVKLRYRVLFANVEYLGDFTTPQAVVVP